MSNPCPKCTLFALFCMFLKHAKFLTKLDEHFGTRRLELARVMMQEVMNWINQDQSRLIRIIQNLEKPPQKNQQKKQTRKQKKTDLATSPRVRVFVETFVLFVLTMINQDFTLVEVRQTKALMYQIYAFVKRRATGQPTFRTHCCECEFLHVYVRSLKFRTHNSSENKKHMRISEGQMQMLKRGWTMFLTQNRFEYV